MFLNSNTTLYIKLIPRGSAEEEHVCGCENFHHRTSTCQPPNEANPRQCLCDGEVKLGWGDRWTGWKKVHGEISCSNGAFGGDPFGGQAKDCICRPDGAGPPQPTGICPSGYDAVATNLDGTGKRWAQPHPSASRTIQQCADICNARGGCTGFEYADGPREHGACGTYTGGESNQRANEDRLAAGANWRSCLKPAPASQTEFTCGCENFHHPTSTCEAPNEANPRQCLCDGEVKLGWGNRWTGWKEVHGGISCTNGAFGGDPYRGQAKDCICRPKSL